MNSDSPFISLNSTDADYFGFSPLLHLAEIHGCGAMKDFEVPDKIALLLARGADVSQRDSEGNSCLHIAMKWAPRVRLNTFQPQNELRDILTLMITAGADIYAINEGGTTVSQVAHAEGHYQILVEVLETCGYDADKVSQKYELRDADHGWSSAIETSGDKPPAEWSSKLSFAAYFAQREEKRKASYRVTEIVDDKTAEDDWVREEDERIRTLQPLNWIKDLPHIKTG